MGHGHHHHHTSDSSCSRAQSEPLSIQDEIGLRQILQMDVFKAFCATGLVMAVELVGGVWTQSLGLLGDAFHMASDSLGLALAYGVGAWVLMGLKAASDRGLTKTAAIIGKEKIGRVESIVAIVQAIGVGLLAIWLVYESYQRVNHQVFGEIKVSQALGISVFGLFGNLLTMKFLHGHDFQTANAEAAYLHVLSDLLSSMIVIFALIAVKFTGLLWIDPVCALMGAGWILYQATKLAKKNWIKYRNT